MKRIVPFLLSAAFILQLFSCSSTQPEINETDPYTGIYQKTEIPADELSLKYTANYDKLIKCGSKIHFSGYTRENDNSSINYILTLDTAAGSLTYERIPVEGIPSRIHNFSITDTGYCTIVNMASEMNQENDFQLFCIENGEIVWQKPVDSLLPLTDRTSVIHMESFGNTVCLSAESNAVIFDINSAENITSAALPDKIGKICVHPDGKFYLFGAVGSKEYLFGREDSTVSFLQTYDPASGETSSVTSQLNEVSQYGVTEYYVGEGYDLYFRNDNGLFGHNFGGEDHPAQTVPLINWVNSGIPVSGLEGFCISDSKTFYAAVRMDRSEPVKLVRLTESAEDPSGRKTVKISYINYGSNYTIPEAAIKFNESQTEYTVICEEMESSLGEGGYASMLSGLDKEILAGTAGDIIMMNSEENVRKYAQQGVLADLYSLMGEGTADNMFNCVKQLYETDGKLYAIPDFVSVRTFASAAGSITETWNIAAFLDTAASLAVGAEMAALRGSELQEILIGCAVHDYLESSFENEEFIRLLGYLRGINGKAPHPEAYERAPYYTGQVVLYSDYINRFDDYIAMKFMFDNAENAEIIGLPSSEGGVTALQPGTTYAISSVSEVKEGAWEFIEYLLSPEIMVEKQSRMKGFPSLKTTYEARFAEDAKYYYYLHTDGGVGSGSSPDQAQDDDVYAVIQLDTALKEEIAGWLDTMSVMPAPPSHVTAIINEELSAFYSDARSAEETAKIIQSRVNIYINERN